MKNPTSKKYPILITTENLEVGGAEKYTVILANELYKRGFKVIVLANNGPFRKQFNPGIRFVRAFFEHGFWGFVYGVFQIIRLSITESVKLVHAQKLESSKAAWVAKFFTKVPVIKTAHGYTRKELTYLGVKINKYSDKVVTVVDWLEIELNKNGVASSKLSVIYNGINLFDKVLDPNEKLDLKKKLSINSNEVVLVSAARLERGKHYKELVNWFFEILKVAPNTKLVIVGNGPEKNNLIEQSNNLGLNNSIIFVKGTTDIGPYLQIGDIFCTPTVARGMAVLEAMTAGLPVVGILPAGEPQVVINGQTGLTIPKDAGNEYAIKTAELILNQKLAKQMGEAGKQRVVEHFSVEEMVDQVEDLYNQTLTEIKIK